MSDKIPYINIHTHSPREGETTIRTIGVHPYDAEEYRSVDLQLGSLSEIDAIGEIGLDFAISTDREIQERVFREQLFIAQEANLPVVIHAVRSFDMALKIIDQYRLRSVISHGFIGSRQQALEAQKRGYFLSFGARTFASPKTLDALCNIHIDNIFIETDEADISIEEVYNKVSEVRGDEITEFKQKIYNNYKRLFQ